MIKKVDHIGIATSNLEEIRELYKHILPDVEPSEHVVESQKSKMLCYDVAGVHLEFLEPTSDASPIAKFLAKGRKGMHHICFETDDIKADIEKMASEGCKLIDKEPREGMNNTKVAFIHPASCGAVLTELCQKS